MIYSRFGTALALISKTQSAGGLVMVQATVDASAEPHEYSLTDLKADGGIAEINTAVAKLPLKVFFSYSSADSAERDILEQQLTALRENGLIKTWHDRMLPLGKWEPHLHEKLREADIFLVWSAGRS